MKRLHRFVLILFLFSETVLWAQITLTPKSITQDSFTARLDIALEPSLTNSDFEIQDGAVTYGSEGTSIGMVVTAVTGYSPEKAREVSSLGTLAAYLDELPSASITAEKGHLGVVNRDVDAGEAIIFTITDLKLNPDQSLIIPTVSTRMYTRDDSSDFFVYDFSENAILLKELNRTGPGTNSFKAGTIALEHGDKLIFSAGVSGTPSWRLGLIQIDLVKTEAENTQSSVAVTPTRGINSTQDYSYIGMNGASHKIRAFFPDPDEYPGPRPCAIFFHGGGWSGGSLSQFNPICDYLAGRGMVAITADYSLLTKEQKEALPAGESRKRICVIDGKTVIRWAKANAEELGIDTKRIAAGGGSAGGHIAALAMMDQQYNNPKDPQDIDTAVQAFLLFCPAFTTLDRDQKPDVNVFHHLEGDWPPTLFLVGETDGWKNSSDALVYELKARDVDVENWMAPDRGHMFFRKEPWNTLSILKLDHFLVERGFLQGPSNLKTPEETLLQVP
ncbi:MAG: alpha/beta hydrolase fold domain-containing protein [Verrucomicrobiota bacterium]